MLDILLDVDKDLEFIMYHWNFFMASGICCTPSWTSTIRTRRRSSYISILLFPLYLFIIFFFQIILGTSGHVESILHFIRFLLLKNYNTEMVLYGKKRLKIYIMTHSWFSYLTSTRGIKEMHDNIVHHGVQHSVVDPDPVGSISFGRIRIRVRIHFKRYGSGSG